MLWTSLVQTKYIKEDSFITQFLIYVVPILSCLTFVADYAVWVTIGMGTIGFYLGREGEDENKEKEKEESGPKSFLTVYRAGTMISTCIAILAVDFQVFPRRFAKVETFGTSLVREREREREIEIIKKTKIERKKNRWMWVWDHLCFHLVSLHLEPT